MNGDTVIWALSAIALSEIFALGAFILITIMFTIIAWPLMFFLKSLYTVILGYKI